MIKNGKVVQLTYSLKDANGKILDRADAKEPFSYLHGSHQIVPGLESALEGLKVGDQKVVVVQPDQGYGIKDPKLKMVVKRSQFPEDVEMEAGMQFQTRGQDGDVVFTVDAIEGDQVHIDGNHPLAGEVLHFDVQVVEVRDATEEEKSHGHAHGPDGHGHHH